MKITVYCSASDGCNIDFIRAAEELGRWIGANGHSLIFGASYTGLMGTVCNAALDAGAEVTGVVPDIPYISARKSTNLSNTIYTSSMAERKTVMMDLADCFIVLPGGPGTLDELSEILCLRSIGTTDKPIILYNVNGFYDGFSAFLQTMVDNGVAKSSIHSLFSLIRSTEELNSLLA